MLFKAKKAHKPKMSPPCSDENTVPEARPRALCCLRRFSALRDATLFGSGDVGMV